MPVPDRRWRYRTGVFPAPVPGWPAGFGLPSVTGTDRRHSICTEHAAWSGRTAHRGRRPPSQESCSSWRSRPRTDPVRRSANAGLRFKGRRAQRGAWPSRAPRPHAKEGRCCADEPFVVWVCLFFPMSSPLILSVRSGVRDDWLVWRPWLAVDRRGRARLFGAQEADWVGCLPRLQQPAEQRHSPMGTAQISENPALPLRQSRRSILR